jgi:ATP adenylyltransferase
MSAFEKLKKFISQDMTMSHVYQPVMLIRLLQDGGAASAEAIAGEILKHDPTQVEYYTQVVKKMVGQVLTNSRGITSKDGDQYTLIGSAELNSEEKKHLIDLCNQRLAEFTEKRGQRVFDHRRRGRRPISGSIRFAVLKRAKMRCELCGIHDEDRWLEVDHINPKSLGGADEIDNYQALCYTCNQNKGNGDDEDFRKVVESYKHREAGCVFCEVPEERIINKNALGYVIKDNYPVTAEHRLFIPHRHSANYFELFQAEVNALNRLMEEERRKLLSQDPSISGFNIGMNCGEDAGQTIFHCHIHLIPRRAGDVESPRGGIRNTIPGKGSY